MLLAVMLAAVDGAVLVATAAEVRYDPVRVAAALIVAAILLVTAMVLVRTGDWSRPDEHPDEHPDDLWGPGDRRR